MKYRILIFVVILLSHVAGEILAQDNKLPLLYISGHAGIYIPASDDFNDNYDANYGFDFGVGFGVPIFTPKAQLFVKVSYFSISNNGDVKASLKEWIINGGFKYRFLQPGTYHLYLVGGGTLITGIREKVEFPDGTGWGLSGSAVGYFIGGGIEKTFSKNPFSVFVEAEYNNSWESILNFKERGGVNVSLGTRFNFDGRGNKPQ